MKTIHLFVILFALAANVAEAQTPPVGTNSSYHPPGAAIYIDATSTNSPAVPAYTPPFDAAAPSLVPTDPASL
jgi:hypothetical protein